MHSTTFNCHTNPFLSRSLAFSKSIVQIEYFNFSYTLSARELPFSLQFFLSIFWVTLSLPYCIRRLLLYSPLPWHVVTACHFSPHRVATAAEAGVESFYKVNDHPSLCCRVVSYRLQHVAVIKLPTSSRATYQDT